MRVLGSVRSAPVRDLVALALIDSDNGLTESLARQAAFRAGKPTDFAGTAAYLLEVVRGQGLDVTGAVLVDASGLSRDNRLAPRTLSDLLGVAASGTSAAFASAVERLPVAALSGTLAQRFGDPAAAPAVGIVRAKTGTLTGVSALAGTVVTADGRPLRLRRSGTITSRNTCGAGRVGPDRSDPRDVRVRLTTDLRHLVCVTFCGT
ncbi:MAG: D-alanyl-D-alanine carboxypeptidase/D-alanyl-D-alanine-endopeptidase [Dermatophilaceae bacterium]